MDFIQVFSIILAYIPEKNKCMQTLEESVTENPLKMQPRLFTCDSPRDWNLFPRSVFMQEERLHFLLTIFKKHSSQILLGAGNRHSLAIQKHPDRKVLFKPRERFFSNQKKKHRNRTERASRFRWGTANARHTEVPSLFLDIRWGWKFVKRRDFCFRGHDFGFGGGSSELSFGILQ
ncbi:hypothetical protein CDAR_489631 [Caerostris darwini]|uniref:Uncharacterized protein n=1 Tax=Caerostris darwini TaxID=1538125 RepID=A0AAV4VJS6_9ARAC|nr:hypothetical protein CDAR_489631 [Caerostris darwini]